jgi:hypothetical protein
MNDTLVERVTPYDTGYSKGYFKALLDLRTWLDEHSESVQTFRLNNYADLKLIVQYFLDHHREAQMYGGYLEVHLPKSKKPGERK